jgi:(S)-3,5-dihydroxyphenylglycine transaminase
MTAVDADLVSRDDPPLSAETLHAALGEPLLDTMNFLNEVTHRYPGAISFAPGRPYDGFFPTEEVFTHVRRYLDHLAATGASPCQVRDAIYQYGPAAGRIRDLVAAWLRREEDIDAEPESIVVTVGCQEAMLLAVRALIRDAADALLVSTPSYVGISGVARLLDVEVTGVPERAGGFHPDALESAVRAERARGRRPRAFYVVPDHANPSGATMSLPVRATLLEQARRHDLILLEDSPYRLVSPGPQLPTLKSMDRYRRVVHLGSFAKTLFPGARVGYVVADQRVRRADGSEGLLAAELAKVKSMVTVNTSPLGQAAVGGMLLDALERGSVRDPRVQHYYGEAMRLTLAELSRHFPVARQAEHGVRWNAPAGGFFLALHLPFPAGEAELARSAEHFGVIWTPMSYFYPDGGGECAVRLSTSYLSAADIVEGVERLARFIQAGPRPQKGLPS